MTLVDPGGLGLCWWINQYVLSHQTRLSRKLTQHYMSFIQWRKLISSLGIWTCCLNEIKIKQPNVSLKEPSRAEGVQTYYIGGQIRQFKWNHRPPMGINTFLLLIITFKKNRESTTGKTTLERSNMFEFWKALFLYCSTKKIFWAQGIFSRAVPWVATVHV